MAEQMKLSLDREEVDVVLTGKDGVEKHWTLMELLAEDRNKYLNKLTARTVLSKDGQTARIKSFAGFQSDLLCASLIDEDGQPVEMAVIEALPSRTQQDLFERAQNLSGINKKKDGEDEEDEKGNA